MGRFIGRNVRGNYRRSIIYREVRKKKKIYQDYAFNTKYFIVPYTILMLEGVCFSNSRTNCQRHSPGKRSNENFIVFATIRCLLSHPIIAYLLPSWNRRVYRLFYFPLFAYILRNKKPGNLAFSRIPCSNEIPL